MIDDLSPEGINREHGKPTWTCWKCKAETGLHWHNGWSVAMCYRPECGAEYNAMIKRQEDDHESYLAAGRELYGDTP